MVAEVLDDPVSATALRSAVGELLARNFAAWAIMDPVEWAETIRRMPGEHGSTRGFTFNYAPYQREPYLEIFNPRNQEVALMLASRMGKSEIVLTALGCTIHQRPRRCAVMWPVEGDGKLWVKDDLVGSLIEPTPELAAIIGDDTGRRKSDNTLLFKRFPGGSLTVLGANATGRLRRVKAPFVYADEIDAIEMQAAESKDGKRKGKGEGDVLAILSKRASEFPDRSEVYCSYPSLKHRSRIEAKLLDSDLRQWFVTCLLCGGEPFIFSRTGVDPFNDGRKRSRLLYDPDDTAGARLECPCCKGHLDDDQRYAMMMGGDPANPRFDLWQATRPFRGKVGYHANSLLWPHNHGDPAYLLKFPGGYLQELAEKELAIEKKDNPEHARMVLVNTEDAETYERPCDVKPDHSKLFLRREDYDPGVLLPEGVLWITFFVDVQSDRLELGFQGFGERKHVWELDYQVIKGSPLVEPDKGVWAELDRLLLTTTWAHPSGAVLRVVGGLVDRGYQPDKVLAFTRTRAARGIFASRGSTDLAKPIIERRARKEGNPPAKVWEIGTHEAKDIIYQKLELDNPVAEGYRHYPKLGWCSEPFFKGLTAEDSEMRKGRDGKWHRWFGCDQGVRNEPLDIAVGCMASERIHKPKYEKIKADFEALKTGKKVSPDTKSSVAEAKKEAAAAARPPTRSFVNRGGVIRRQGPAGSKGGFVNGWRG